jgi:hypothetical protein
VILEANYDTDTLHELLVILMWEELACDRKSRMREEEKGLGLGHERNNVEIEVKGELCRNYLVSSLLVSLRACSSCSFSIIKTHF